MPISILTAEGLAKLLQKIKTVFVTKTELNTVSESLANQTEENCVHKTGNETIAGTKTFSSTISGTVDKALKDGSGSTISSTYLKLSGGTMTDVMNISHHIGNLQLKLKEKLMVNFMIHTILMSGVILQPMLIMVMEQ